MMRTMCGGGNGHNRGEKGFGETASVYVSESVSGGSYSTRSFSFGCDNIFVPFVVYFLCAYSFLSVS